MNRNLLKLMAPKFVALTGVVFLSAAIAVAQDAAPADPAQAQPAAQAPTRSQGPRTDGQIEMDVVRALDASPALKNDLITAATIQSEVTLSGTVSSDASKQLAESISSHVDGVSKVHDNLKVGNPGTEAQNMPPADASAQEMHRVTPSLKRLRACRLRPQHPINRHNLRPALRRIRRINIRNSRIRSSSLTHSSRRTPRRAATIRLSGRSMATAIPNTATRSLRRTRRIGRPADL